MPRVDRAPARPRTVVVSGLGAVTPFGWNVPSTWNGLRSGKTSIGPFDRFDHSGYRTHVAAQVDLARAAPRPRGKPARISLADRYAVCAAREALSQAGLGGGDWTRRAGVYFGSSTGGMLENERYFEALLAAEGGARRRLPRMSILAPQQYNAPGDAVAREIGIGGPVQTVSAACASGGMAIGDALRAVRSGEVETAITGGSDSLCRLTYAGFNALRSVDERPCRPFRKDRAGLSIGEGAGVIVLEPLERVLARGARPLAVAAGEAATCDAYHMTAPHPLGAGAAEAIGAALADAQLDPGEIDFVNAHGTGTPLNDLAECEALASVFGERARELPVTSTKSLVGHLLGSAGAVEAVATILCLVAGEVHPMPAEGESDPAIGVQLVLGSPLKLKRARHALSTSLAFGGANAALIFSRPRPEDRDAD
ncbi:MAG TPA: beta-ketoacyl-[acyl-carrier-protein] synthase family protein [Candidatus Polarisedimenticolia bacterium]|jgi:3-oxoacyl-[acyl-carrier-protein] synthase II|nr:beta-ketoacyl-[acyl-carrier-protein] synthase family protein [Candidatus Polarisedimenticolia bacterium]